MGIHTALDTNGYYGDRLSDAELAAVDLVLLDLKTLGSRAPPPPHGHGDRADPGVRAPAGRAPEAGLAPLRAGAGADRRPGRGREIAGFAAGLGNVERVDVLPFHQMGRFKWKELGLEYKLE